VQKNQSNKKSIEFLKITIYLCYGYITYIDKGEFNLKLLKIGLTGIFVGTLLTGCGTDEVTEVEIDKKVEVAHEVKVEAATIDPKEWKDVTVVDEGMKYDFATNAKDFIANENRLFHNVDVRDPLFDKEYFYYLEAMALNAGLNIVQVEGVDLQKDFDNLQRLAAIIEVEQIKRGEELDPDTYGKNKRNAVKDWKAPTERMTKAIEYTKQLLNDIDVTINHDGKGETFEVSYQADGNKVEELSHFIASN